MNEVIAYFTQISTKLPCYARYIHIVVIALIIALTEAIKLPLRKYVIDVKIASKNARKKVNLVFMVLPFGLGLGASGVLTCFGYAFSWEAGLAWGVYAQVAYEFVARIILKIKSDEKVDNKVIADTFKEVKKEAEDIAKAIDNATKVKAEETAKDFDDFVKKIKGE